MPTQATIVLDSGSFLPKEAPYCEIGYFQCEAGASDLRIFADGEELTSLPDPFKLGTGLIEVRHLNADGTPKRGDVKASKSLHKQVLHLKDLYGADQLVARDRFDCIIRFECGHFCASMVKKRYFKRQTEQTDGTYKADPGHLPKEVGPIAHNVAVHYVLKENEVLELARDGVPFWSSKNYMIRDRLDIEIMADNSTAEKFFCHTLSDRKSKSRWVPNQGDPPPTCPHPPCIESP